MACATGPPPQEPTVAHAAFNFPARSDIGSPTLRPWTGLGVIVTKEPSEHQAQEAAAAPVKASKVEQSKATTEHPDTEPQLVAAEKTKVTLVPSFENRARSRVGTGA